MPRDRERGSGLGALPERAARHIAWRSRRAAGRVIDTLRRGDRCVIMTPPAGLRFGNWLYLWLDAHARTAAGEPTVIREAPGMAPWLEAFPALRDLTVVSADIRFHDRREWDPATSWHQRFGSDFSRAEVRAFVGDVLAPCIVADQTDTVVVNVRRGDYYADPGHRARYGFDQIGYLREALGRVGAVQRVLFVSDDPDWCRRHAGEVLPTDADVEYAPADPVGNFLAIAGARRLVGTNSTFSYWGGYAAGAIHRDAVVVMPRFHARLPEGEDAYQLDPAWTIIEGYS